METTTQTFNASEIEAAGLENLETLVSKATDGERLDPAEIQAACWATGRTLGQFQSYVDVQVRRLKAASDLAEAEALGPAIDQAKADEQDAAQRLRKAEAEAAKLVAGPTGDLAEARRVRASLEKQQADLAGPAKMVLVNTADESFDKEIADVESSVCELHNVEAAGREAANKLQFFQGKICELQRMVERNEYPMSPVAEIKKEITEIEANLPKLQSKIEAGEVATAKLATIAERVQELQKEKLRPEAAMAW